MVLNADAISQQSLPKHVAIIMDGNGRWAQARKRPRAYGHKKGVDSVRSAVQFCSKLGIESLTLFAFSSENWRRPEDEVSTLMELFLFVLSKEVKKLHKNNVKLNIIGDISKFPTSLQDKVHDAHALTGQNTGLQLNIAANYGGRWDITNAAQALAEQVKSGELDVTDITEDALTNNMSMADQSPLDLLVRTGGDYRISNFLLWQAAYAELYFTETLWPDFNEEAFSEAIACYISRERRFGCTGEQIKQLLAESNTTS
ncbi:isoprenyl transferase [Pseudoalteromonas luteoviolacea]|uniref:Ditrans,polycis-undecaprenyl-diphosphate synthase ((2E,6E)-farnesyl-diphosphate specific) n=1 Tax=Pseudoalteromonas luteoviolacea S4054 TaxID=1129367 RepID=A0A0F6AEM2_9GAMM|nr:isoprenyl transferase [Pseudoalteromonas luteoviolacea]AOT07538.1 di-trans,poly-cis-decaprenylcistransferase [Pseudoalteromonas luteoviolacea]AOT12454.1 di-trans,poly-cis-decaprenylcistransferase [Pseudoalteromonas luteoviolacea]AOT17368.1 di-trans,poly-cis-decaprenylcistransferase [Pseudoalteromonas luteoviolacea]KKE84650.1 UDP pyrophosphate synthase [Pseudoalteromonas luteoviolacea S4054]KZN74250.1 UDP pyrophosphate synthase [Pseudoalteromonas luteoviolacea S4047-1]